MKVRLPQQQGGYNDMIKAAQKMQEDMATLQADLEQREYTASSGGGMVKATVNGKHELLSLKIEPEIIDPDDSEMLEDLVIAAINEANSLASKNAEEEMGQVTSGLNIPGMPGLF